MSIKRILLSAPMFFATLAAGVGSFAGTAAIAARIAPAEPTRTQIVATMPPQPMQIPVKSLPVLSQTDESPVDVNEEPTVNTYEEVEWHGVYGFKTDSLPNGLRDLRYIEIMLYDFDKIDENGNPGAPIPPKGFLNAGKEFKFERIALAGDQIAFQTETINGVSYRFTGKYRKVDNTETEELANNVSGELIKIVSGKWAASAKVELFEEHGC